MGSSPFTRTTFRKIFPDSGTGRLAPPSSSHYLCGPQILRIMFYVLLTMFAGAGVGWLLRRWKPLKHAGKAVSAVIWLMLFLLGAEIGSDRALVASLPSIGLQALIFAAAGIGGSVLAAALLHKLLIRRKEK